MEGQIGTEQATSVPAQPNQVDGGGVAEMNAQLEQAQKAYQGMQRKYNGLFEDTQRKDAEIEGLSTQMAALQRQIDELSGKATSAQEQATTLNTEKTKIEQDYTQAQAERDMWRLISTKYPELGGIVESLSLTPKGSLEATEEMLSGMQGLIQSQVQSIAKQQVASYNSTGGNIGKPAPMTQEQLRKEMARTAGTPAYQEVATQYYALVEHSGEYPKPSQGPFDHLM